jgi:hypothetical protein
MSYVQIGARRCPLHDFIRRQHLSISTDLVNDIASIESYRDLHVKIKGENEGWDSINTNFKTCNSMVSNLALNRINGFEIQYGCIHYNCLDQVYFKQTFQ